MKAESQLFRKVYDEVVGASSGVFKPEVAADLLSQKAGKPHLRESLLDILRHPQTKEAVYPDVIPFVNYILASCRQPLTIWTQGEIIGLDKKPGYQLRKLQDAQLNQKFGTTWRKLNKEAGLPRLVGGTDKLAELHMFCQQIGTTKHSDFRIQLIDDVPKNIIEGLGILSSHNIGGEGVLIDRENKYASGYLQLSNARVVRSLNELHGAIKPHTAHFMDLDYTSLDHAKVRASLEQKVNALLN